MRRIRFYGRVIGHAFRFSGWVAGIVTVAFGGSVAAAFGFLRHYHHHSWAVGVLGIGSVLAVLEGAHRVWSSTDDALQEAKGRLRELDDPGAKCAYLNEMASTAKRLQEEIEAIPDSEFWGKLTTVGEDIVHWENGVRAVLRESFGRGDSQFFDSEDGFTLGEDDDHQSKTGAVSYLSRRITRLDEIRKRT